MEISISASLKPDNGFWQIDLDEESRNLCCISSPFGRFRLLRMPFGIASVPEIFQKKIIEVFEGMDGAEILCHEVLVNVKIIN